MGSTNRTAWAYVLESTPGVTPTNPAFKALRDTSVGIVATPNRVTSNEIRADRQVTDQVLVSFDSGGPVGGELSYGTHDDFIEWLLQGTWSVKAVRDNAGTADSVITAATASSDTFTVTDAAIDFVEGHLVLASGFTNAGNNQLFRAQASTSGVAVIAPASPGLTDEAVPPAAAKLKAVGFEGASGDIVATVTGGNAFTSSSLDFTTLGIQVGEWVKGGGDSAGSQFATAANNAWYRVSAVAAHRLDFDIVPASFGADAGTSKTIQVFFGDFVKNGVTQRAATFEGQQQDITVPSFEYHTGEQADTGTFRWQAGAIITAEFGFVGIGSTIGTARVSGATDVAPTTTDVLNAASNVAHLFEGGALAGGPSYITQLSIEVKNNLERQRAIGSIGAVGIRNGEFNVSIGINAYFGDIALQQKVTNDTPTSITLINGRADGNRERIMFDVPRAKLSGTAPTSGKNQDRMFQGTAAAYRHPTLGYTMSAGRFAYLPAAN